MVNSRSRRDPDSKEVDNSVPEEVLHIHKYTYAPIHLHAIHTHTYSKEKEYQVWWCIPLMPALEKQTQIDLCEFQVRLDYTVSSRPARVTE